MRLRGSPIRENVVGVAQFLNTVHDLIENCDNQSICPDLSSQVFSS